MWYMVGKMAPINGMKCVLPNGFMGLFCTRNPKMNPKLEVE
jgi:hypothetical protein